MEEFKCRNCGGPFDLKKAVNGVIRCEYCRSVFTVPKKELSPAALSFLRQGEHDLDTCSFDNAYEAYRKASEYDKSEPEAYWGMALATAKVQYLKDIVHNRLQPICHEISAKKFSDDKNYKRAMELATEEQKKTYSAKAKEIDAIRAEFCELKKQGLDYDCFICVKVSDEEGKHTSECGDAFDLYYHLKGKGYAPFFSECELKGAVGADYEARILYALYTSECMLIVCNGEHEEYLQTPWVRNEYTRFNRMVNDEEKERRSISFVFRGTPIEKLPGKPGRIEGIDLAKPDAYSRIEEYVSSFTPIQFGEGFELHRKNYDSINRQKRINERKGVEKRKFNELRGGVLTVSDKTRLDTAAGLLMHAHYDEAQNVWLDPLIKENPANARAYLLRFFCENKCSNAEAWIAQARPVKSFESFEKAISASPDEEGQSRLYEMLYKRVCACKLVSDFSEFVQLPNSSDAAISKLVELMYKKALATKDKAMFDEIVKPVTDSDQYIKMNLAFARALPLDDAVKYYKNILDIDEGHNEAILRIFIAESGYTDDAVFESCKQLGADVLEKKLFAFHFNSEACEFLFSLCIKQIGSQTDDACKLFDFVCSMIPQKFNAKLTEFLNTLIEALFRKRRLKFISKYNELLLSLDPSQHGAYFNRMMLEHNYSNALELLNMREALLTNQNYCNAMNCYGQNYPNQNNLYIELNEAVHALRTLLSDKTSRDYALEHVYVTRNGLLRCKGKIIDVLKKAADQHYRVFLETYHCSTVEELYKLRTIVVNNTDLQTAYAYATTAGYKELQNEIAEILKNQGAAVKDNLIADEAALRRKRRKRAKTATLVIWNIIVYGLLVWAIVLSIVHSEYLNNDESEPFYVTVFLFILLVIDMIGVGLARTGSIGANIFCSFIVLIGTGFVMVPLLGEGLWAVGIAVMCEVGTWIAGIGVFITLCCLGK